MNALAKISITSAPTWQTIAWIVAGGIMALWLIMLIARNVKR
jgi:hypothetical protein